MFEKNNIIDFLGQEIKTDKIKEVLSRPININFDYKRGLNGFNKKPNSPKELTLNRNHLLGLVVIFFLFGAAIMTTAVIFSDKISPAFSNYLDSLKSNNQAENGQAALSQPGFSDYTPQTTQEQAVINVVKAASPAVVSIVITKDVPVYESYFENQSIDNGGLPFDIQIEVPKQKQTGTERKAVGAGSGFIVSPDGMIITNKHVVSDETADYTVIISDNKKYTAEVLALDPLQDLAILQIREEVKVNEEGAVAVKDFPTLKLGKSDNLQIGQTVIAIGNALGEFRNTVSVGVISGLARSLSATDGNITETLEDVIQTDAAINKGNSGGPLLNLRGEVIGVNTAMAQDGQSIGFSIQVDKARRDLEQVKEQGRIVYPFLGIVYVPVTEELQQDKKLSVNYGAYIPYEEGKISIVEGSAAEKAGLKLLDIILEVNGEKADSENTLSKIIKKYFPGDKVKLKVLRDEKEIFIDVTLGEIASDNNILDK